jgi:hypothetical protein
MADGAIVSHDKPTSAEYAIAMTDMNVKPIAGERSWEFGKIIRR